MNGLGYSAVVIWLFGSFSFAYIALVLYLINYYLPRFHAATWAKLGRPLFQQPLFRLTKMAEDLQKWSLTAKFMLMTNDYAMLKDPRLTKLIWSIRMFFVGGGALFLWIFLQSQRLQ
jgi:hypothetical protein